MSGPARSLFCVMRLLHFEWPCTCGVEPYLRCGIALALPWLTPRRLCAPHSPLPVAVARRAPRY